MSGPVSESKRRESKICVVCQRPFQWRKKWQRCWDEVKYCSERCRRSTQSRSPSPSDSKQTNSKTTLKDLKKNR
ncbi:DUF2256 domain-containing protein [Rubripirellula obstinata]|uniref:DUF2256 domain-containing protein n=1 Tax=Rubripirellula obstinata TaxID=406547 RepID=UPI000A04CFEF